MNTNLNLKNLFHTFTSELTMNTILSLFVAFLLSAFATPAFAQDSAKWEAGAGQFRCGSASTYDAGATTIPQAVSQAVAGWDACIAQFGNDGCSVMAKGYTVGPAICDYTRNHDPMDGALGDARAEAIFRAFNEQRPAAIAHRLPNQVLMDTAYKAAYLVIRPIPNAVRITHTCNNRLDDDGDGKVDMADPGCESPEDDSEFNRDSRSLYLTGIAASRVLRDVSDRNCPWDVKAIFNPGGDVTFQLTKLDPTCHCDDEKPFGTERDYVAALEAEIGNPGPVPAANASEAVLYNYYDSVRSIFTDDVGAEWNESMFIDYGYLKITKTANYCEQIAADEFVTDYKGVNGVVLGGGTLQGSTLGDGNSISGHPWGSVAGEFGFTAGSSRGAFLMTVGAGGTFDDNCDLPAAFMSQARIGGIYNPSGRAGIVVDFRPQWSVGPSYKITPDDEATQDENEYSVDPAIGTNSLALLVDAGAMISFGEVGGMKNGFVLLTATAGPKLRWLPDADDQNVRHPTLTGDVGGSVAVGWMF